MAFLLRQFQSISWRNFRRNRVGVRPYVPFSLHPEANLHPVTDGSKRPSGRPTCGGPGRNGPTDGLRQSSVRPTRGAADSRRRSDRRRQVLLADYVVAFFFTEISGFLISKRPPAPHPTTMTSSAGGGPAEIRNLKSDIYYELRVSHI